jgi:RNA polymerase sigma factor for flagellar operon FliA
MSRRTPERDGVAVAAEDDQLKVVNGNPRATRAPRKAAAEPPPRSTARPATRRAKADGAGAADSPAQATGETPATVEPPAERAARGASSTVRKRAAATKPGDTVDVTETVPVVEDAAEKEAEPTEPVAVSVVLPDDVPDPEAAATALRELWEGFKATADQQLRERLILHYSPLVKYVAGRVGVGLPPNIEQADLVSYGIFGLIDAIEKFDLERAIKFETYAISRIRGAIIDELRAIDWIPRSVRYKAREVEKAYAALEGQLHRTPTESEVADQMGIKLEDLHAIFSQVSFVNVVALDELLNVGGEKGDKLSLVDTLEDTRAEDPVAAFESEETKYLLAKAINTFPSARRSS